MPEPQYRLPAKLKGYLRRLSIEYRRAGETGLAEIVETGVVSIEEAAQVDSSFNDYVVLHNVFLTLSPKVFDGMDLNEQENTGQRLVNDLNQCAKGFDQERFRRVYLELGEVASNGGVSSSTLASANPDDLRIWKQGHIRLFVSHRDRYKKEANSLSAELETLGVSCFVAHDTIQPLSTWQDEILKGLRTMEVMLAFITDDFNESAWTQQEVGYALGKGIPVLALKLEKSDPTGFIGKLQALKGRMDYPQKIARDVYNLIVEKLDNGGRIREALISSFVNSPDFNETRDRFNRLEGAIQDLTPAEVGRIVKGFRDNDQLHNAIYLSNRYRRLEQFLRERTGKNYEIKGKQIVERE